MRSPAVHPFVVAVVAAALSAASAARAGTIHVPADQPTIQQGIALAVDGDTVLVAPGRYLETIDLLGKQLVVQSEGGADVTTIDGGGNGTVVTLMSGEPVGT